MRRRVNPQLRDVFSGGEMMSEHSHSHGHACCHSHGHNHGGTGPGHASEQSRRRLKLTLWLVLLYAFAEAVGGLFSNSLALLADSGHMFSDAASLGLSCFAIWLTDRPAGRQRTFGFYRAEIMAALINASTLVFVSGWIVLEAWHRLHSPLHVHGTMMMGVATGGLVVNLLGLFILHGGLDHNLNVRGAWLHVLADTLGSVAAILSGTVIHWFGWQQADPIISVAIAALILFSSWRLLSESTWVLMEGAPQRLKVDDVHLALAETAGVASIHDLHVWTISSGLDSLSCHVVSDGSRPYAELLETVRRIIHDRFLIEHVTIQIEPEGFLEPALPV